MQTWAPETIAHLVPDWKVRRGVWEGQAWAFFNDRKNNGAKTVLALGHYREMPDPFWALEVAPEAPKLPRLFTRPLRSCSARLARESLPSSVFELARALRVVEWSRLAEHDQVFRASVFGLPVLFATAEADSAVGRRAIARGVTV